MLQNENRILFPSLLVLEELKQFVPSGIDFNTIYLISVQHLLETTGSLFEAIIDIGFRPDHIFLKGKVYSSNSEVAEKLRSMGIRVEESRLPTRYGILLETHCEEVEEMWLKLREKLTDKDTVIILDDGGSVIKYTPKDLECICFGIEQTSSGLEAAQESHIDVIEVASSAAKTKLESVIVADVFVRRLKKYLQKDQPEAIGVIGYGNIGKSLVGHLSKQYVVKVYDKDEKGAITELPEMMRCNSVEQLIADSDFIIGTTGKDISNINWENCASTHKTLVSASSHDLEFNTLIKSANQEGLIVENVLDDFYIYLKSGGSLLLIRGGAVANFDNSVESATREEIQLTRGLLFAAITQILNPRLAMPEFKKLNSDLQLSAVNNWFNNHPAHYGLYSRTVIENFKDLMWIEANS